ncbi:hypothetical protein N7520_003722 [Penicillium odoratum]|uniref:uncharacterized protein n=1 Tax=Penicillium odoratum TaxID=1167516 RepID=UPI0025484521|nr:uncharacterized protein N7520_003722 [Penicillium odoratum]KAJ5769163.1 hypothetical protein N7520_003722 [Penicillium odoratum]
MSLPIQSIVATPLHAVAESNIGLAHLHLDFSLAKFEAPLELRPLGKELSKARRESAEDGSFHILARRLGVLFDDVLPNVPSLLEAYGARASEIVQETTPKLKKPGDIVEGFFGSHLGIDSTTIWASATSGKSVLRIHLLTCMLARIWPPQEATAIWAELVTQRQKIIKNQAQSTEIADNYLAQLAAAHEIDRSSLGKWDASARAWLQVADQARKKEQVQAQLIVNNLSLAVKSHAESDQSFATKTNSYDSVLLNVNRALTTLDKLTKGEPQRITDGGILLGLISWHLYPDLVVLGSSTKEIQQRDPLIKAGGIVTISITSEVGRGEGVYWSLPLASLKYYGTVQQERSTMRDSRISVEQLQALLLGASLGADEAALTAAQILQSLWKIYYNMYQAKMCQLSNKTFEPPEDLLSLHRVDPLQDAPASLRALMRILHILFPLNGGIELVFSADDNEKNTASQLMRYGSNYGRSWIGNTSSSISSLFGLANLSSLLWTITTPAARIQLLRDICVKNHLSPSDYMIRFRTSEKEWAYTSITEESETVHWGKKRKWDQYASQDMGSVKILEIPPDETWAFVAGLEALRGHVQAQIQEHIAWDALYKDFKKNEDEPDTFGTYQKLYSELLEDEPSYGDRTVIFDLVFGQHNLAAVYARRTVQSPRKQIFSSTVPLTMVQDLLDRNLLNLDTLASRLSHHFETEQTAHGNSLLALGRVLHYYKCHLPQATVSMGVIKNKLNSWVWSQSVVNELDILDTLAEQQARAGNLPVSIYPSLLPRESAFAAILQFESGTIDVDTSDLTAVLAVSSGSSLFIAEELLHDPTLRVDAPQYAISHLTGNIGKAGIALLIPPPELNIREHDLERWQFVNHNPFDGKLSGGEFEGTSLHLSFTGWEGPLTLGPSRYRGMDAYFVETLVSVNDGGQWVGDLDILKGLKHLKIQNSSTDKKKCLHDPGFSAAGVKMVSIDCWEEILDPPAGFLVLRSSPDINGTGYWQWMVRLAAVGIAASRNYQCICLPVGDFCWTCVVGNLREHASSADFKPRILFIG